MTTIVKVEPRRIVKYRGATMWRITDADGVVYATDNCFVASLADQYRKKGTRVEIGASAGWFYKDIYSIKPEGGEATVA
jgi:hypothetical protein